MPVPDRSISKNCRKVACLDAFTHRRARDNLDFCSRWACALSFNLSRFLGDRAPKLRRTCRVANRLADRRDVCYR